RRLEKLHKVMDVYVVRPVLVRKFISLGRSSDARLQGVLHGQPTEVVGTIVRVGSKERARLTDSDGRKFLEVPPEHGSSRPRRAAYVFIASKKSLLVLLYFSLSSRNSMASTVPIGFRMRRSTHIFDRVDLSTSSSSLRVPDLVMSIAGKVRLSDSLRSRMISELPVPLNSSKITSSMRLPVSTSAVAIMVSEPPSSMLRAAPKKRFGRCSALASTPPVSTLPDEGTIVL